MTQLGTQMEHEIREQPSLLADNAARYVQQFGQLIRRENYEIVVLVARGTSDNAALYLKYLIEVYWRIPVVLAAPSVLTVFHREVHYPRSLCVGISQSGAAPDVAAVLESLRKAGHQTIAITNTHGSACEEAADHSIYLNAGEERAVAATKTFTASLLAVYQLARCGSSELPEVVLPDEEFLLNARSFASNITPIVSDSKIVFALGRGFSFCSAQECALKLMECARVSCKPFSTADFEHGPKALLAEDAAVIIFGTTPESVRQSASKQINALGSHEVWGPIWDAVFSQWLALFVARHRGLDPDSPALLTKVTKTI